MCLLYSITCFTALQDLYPMYVVDIHRIFLNNFFSDTNKYSIIKVVILKISCIFRDICTYKNIKRCTRVSWNILNFPKSDFIHI